MIEKEKQKKDGLQARERASLIVRESETDFFAVAENAREKKYFSFQPSTD